MRLETTICSPRRISLTPLIDVVFLLLIFFMLSSTFLKFTSVTMTGGKAGTGIAKQVSNLVIIRVHGAGKIDVNGVEVDPSALEAHLKSFKIEGQMRVAIKSAGSAMLQDVVNIFEKVRKQDDKRDVFIVR